MPRWAMRTLLTWLTLLAGCARPEGGPAPADSNDSDTPGADTDPGGCRYPSGATEPMMLGQVLRPYRWPDARSRVDGRQVALDLAHAPCDTAEDIDWSPFDVLLFVSIPAW